MTKLRRAGILLGIATVTAGLWLLSHRGVENGSTARASVPSHGPDHPSGTATQPGDAGVKPAGSEEDAALPPGKLRTRPSSEELAKQRLEIRRVELVERIQKMKEGGIGERHPGLLAAREQLQSIEAEQAAASAGDEP